MNAEKVECPLCKGRGEISKEMFQTVPNVYDMRTKAGNSLMGPIIAELQEQFRDDTKFMAAPGTMDPKTIERRKAALNAAMQLFFGNTGGGGGSFWSAPVSSSGPTMDPMDVVRVAREIDRFLAGD